MNLCILGTKKERNPKMKRIIVAISVALMIMCFAVSSYASQRQVEITGNGTTVSFSYSSDKPSTNSKSIKSLLKNIDRILTGDTVTEKISISSKSEKPVKFYLRLEKPGIITTNEAPIMVTPTPNPKDNSVLDFYNILVKDDKGNVIYDYTEAEKTTVVADFKDIELITLNNEAVSETVNFEITISGNQALEDKINEATMLDWIIVVDGYSQNVSTNAEPETERSDKLEGNIIERSLDKGTYTVGKDILKGRYEISGESTVKVYTEDGDLKTKIILTRDNNSKTAVKDYVLNLLDNEVVEVSNETDFTPYIPSKTTAAIKPKTSPSATTYEKSTTSAKDTTSSKTNPKTGDFVPVTIIFLLGAVSIMLFGILKKNN